MEKLSHLAFHPVKMQSCYEKMDQLKLEGLQQRFDVSSTSVFKQRAQIHMRQVGRGPGSSRFPPGLSTEGWGAEAERGTQAAPSQAGIWPGCLSRLRDLHVVGTQLRVCDGSGQPLWFGAQAGREPTGGKQRGAPLQRGLSTQVWASRRSCPFATEPTGTSKASSPILGSDPAKPGAGCRRGGCKPALGTLLPQHPWSSAWSLWMPR